jgi:hypothetical protein
MGVRKLVAFLFFCLMAEDDDTLYARHIFAPLSFLHNFIHEPLPIKVRPFDVYALIILLIALQKTKGPMVRPMRSALLLSVATTTIWFIGGVLTGGDFRLGSWQVYWPLTAVLFAFTVSATFTTSEHFLLLGKALIAGAFYRAVMCWFFYIFYVRAGAITPLPEQMTTHDDSVKWVAALAMLAVYVVQTNSKGAKRLLIFATPVMLAAIQFNNRRLAWVSLIAAIIIVYVLLPPSRARKRLRLAGLAMMPVVGLYIAIGWGRSERIFKPLKALETTTTTEDASTKSRNNENLGLIATANYANRYIGIGYGKPYRELSSTYRIAGGFELWPYIPHNSIFGILAFTGILGFFGYWLAFPTAAFVNVRTARLAKNPMDRTVAIVSTTNMIIVANQMFGDMGLFSPCAMYLLSASYAAAMRIPIVAGTWPAPAAAAAAAGAGTRGAARPAPGAP